MKKLALLFALCIVFVSCEVEGELTSAKGITIPVSLVSNLKYKGDFSPTSGISVAGSVKIYLDVNQYKLELNNFSISSGPDLKVYLSKSNTPTEFVNLGNLNQATVYAIPQSINVSDYKYVLIHCQQYNHLFAVAQLTQN